MNTTHSNACPWCREERRRRRLRITVHLLTAAAALGIAAIAALGGARDADAHRIRPGTCDRMVAAAEPDARPVVFRRCRAQVREHRREHRRLAARRSVVASCYADGTDGFLGRPTASGAIVRWRSRFVAHRTLPLGSRVVVYANGRRTVAIVADRGPYTHGRDLDLAGATARALGYSSCRSFGVRRVLLARY